VDAGLKGITGDLFAALTAPASAAVAKPLADKAKPAITTALTGVATPAPGTYRAPRPAAPTRKLPAYYYRLPLRAQRVYLASDAIDRFPLTPSPAAFARVAALMQALDGGAPSIVQRASQSLLDEVCRILELRSVRIEVRSVRPHNSRGELHGLFYPQAPARTATPIRSRSATQVAGAPLIVLWMRTAQRHDVVKPRTFLRTLMHELGHYLDYALLKLADSYHSAGFYQRESFLMRTLCPSDRSKPASK